MCGIVGYFGDDAPARRRAFAGAVDLLAHRGPNDRGEYHAGRALLGHRRLSIVDLSAAGHQPMVDPESGAVLVFNGMVYNYVELRRELAALGHRFRSQSDTEVLLKAVVQWRAGALSRLNGMWAFAAWFPVDGELLLARDRFGIKPLCFARSGSRLAFASEAKALLALMPELRAPDPAVVADFLVYGYPNRGHTCFYRGVEVLPPAHFATYRESTGSFRLHRYWDYPAPAPAAPRTAERTVEEFTALFDDAVRLRLQGDVPVGLALSGGLDSTAILASAVRASGAAAATPAVPTCFTSTYSTQQQGEVAWARQAATAYGVAPVEVTAPEEDWLATLSRITWHMDGPCASTAVYPVWTLMAEARRRGTPVILEGQGADEALGGYPHHTALATLRDVHRNLGGGWAGVARALQAVGGLRRTHATRSASLLLLKEVAPWLRKSYYRGGIARRLLHPELRGFVNAPGDSPYAPYAGPPTADGRLAARLLRDHAADVLPGLLGYGDAVSMAHGIETRVPFLDHRLVEWMFALPTVDRVRASESKWLVRVYLRQQRQRAIAERSDKLGYPNPALDWLRADDCAAAREFLLAPDAMVTAFCERRSVERLLGMRHGSAGPVSLPPLYRLLSTELWLRSSVRRDSAPVPSDRPRLGASVDRVDGIESAGVRRQPAAVARS